MGDVRPDFTGFISAVPTNAISWSKAALLSYGGTVKAFRPSDGKLLWSLKGYPGPTGGFTQEGLSVSGDTLFVSGFNGFAAYKLP